MTKRALIAIGIATVIAVASMGTVPLLGQGAVGGRGGAPVVDPERPPN